VIYAVVPFLAFGLFAACTALYISRNVKRTTQSTGVVVGKRFVPNHAGLAANGSRSGGNAVVVVPDSWILEIDHNGKLGTAVVSREIYESLKVGDDYSG